MMEIKDFRTGNWVNEIRCDGKLYPSQITHIQSSNGLNRVKCNGWFADSPIPLTEEILVKKLGFVESCEVDFDDNEFYIFTKNGFRIYNSETSKSFMFDYGDSDYLEIETVHHLQNLYMDIKREELTFKTEG